LIGSSLRARLTLRTIALAYLAALVMAPVVLIFYKTFEHGLSAPIEAISSPDGLHALYMTVLTVVIAVPLNTVFGVGCALLLERTTFPGRRLIDAVINLPFAISPIVIGLSLFLVYSQIGWFGNWLQDNGIQIIFSTPGIILACIFVSIPFVVRETVPVLREVGTEQEEAARTLGASSWQTFWRVTLPSIRWGVGYGVVLTTARVLGEFGAVTIVSGNIIGKTQTLPLFVYQEYQNFAISGAYAATIVLMILALGTLFAMNRFKPKEGTT